LDLFAALLKLRERLWLGYAIAVATSAAGVVVRLAFGHNIAGAPFFTFIPAIIFSTLAGGIGPGLVTVAISAVFADYFFIPPEGFSMFWPTGYVVMAGFFLVTSTMVILVNATMTSSVRLARATAALRAANETLEARIAARTAELMAAEERLRQSQKMEAVGQLTGGIAHDFNNLLTSISGSLELLQNRLAQGRLSELGRYATAAQDAATRAAALTHRLLAFARQQALEPRVTNIDQLIAGMAALIRSTIDPAITLVFTPTPELWPTQVDPNQLENVLLNLCINASDAMPNGGRLSITTGNKTLGAEEAATQDLQAGGYVALTVADTGRGMTPEVIERAFDPFFTTKPLGQGTGLGLSMIYGFVRQSGGQVRIHSTPGAGTDVQLLLPRYNGAAAPAQPPAAPVCQPVPAHGKTVLVVDDEPTVRMLVLDLLDELDCAGLQAEDGHAGLNSLQTNPDVDLLITDIGLPGGMNGKQLAEAARALRPGLKILFITGYAELSLTDQSQLPAGVQLLTKPFSMAGLASRIGEMLGARGIGVQPGLPLA